MLSFWQSSSRWDRQLQCFPNGWAPEESENMGFRDTSVRGTRPLLLARFSTYVRRPTYSPKKVSPCGHLEAYNTRSHGIHTQDLLQDTFRTLDPKTHWMLQFWVTRFFFQTASVNTNLDTTAAKQSVQQSPAWRPEQLMMRVTLLATTNLPRSKGLYIWHWLVTVSSLPAPGPGCPISLLAHCSLNHVLETTLTNYIICCVLSPYPITHTAGKTLPGNNDG